MHPRPGLSDRSALAAPRGRQPRRAPRPPLGGLVPARRRRRSSLRRPQGPQRRWDLDRGVRDRSLRRRDQPLPELRRLPRPHPPLPQRARAAGPRNRQRQGGRVRTPNARRRPVQPLPPALRRRQGGLPLLLRRRDAGTRPPPSGLHLVTERDREGRGPRADWLRARWPSDPTLPRLRELLTYHGSGRDDSSATCVHGEPVYRTRSSAILRLAPELSAGELFSAEGPPCKTPHEDRSCVLAPLARQA